MFKAHPRPWVGFRVSGRVPRHNQLGATANMGLFALFKRTSDPGHPLPATPQTSSDRGAPADVPPLAPIEMDPPSPADVRRMLFEAAKSGDDARLECLCREHRSFILASGPAWMTPPPEFDGNPQASAWYRDGMETIARFCAERLGENGLAEQLGNVSVSTPELPIPRTQNA